MIRRSERGRVPPVLPKGKGRRKGGGAGMSAGRLAWLLCGRALCGGVAGSRTGESSTHEMQSSLGKKGGGGGSDQGRAERGGGFGACGYSGSGMRSGRVAVAVAA
jgi:hypothetical protein